jgi:hypothetical protein
MPECRVITHLLLLHTVQDCNGYNPAPAARERVKVYKSENVSSASREVIPAADITDHDMLQQGKKVD